MTAVVERPGAVPVSTGSRRSRRDVIDPTLTFLVGLGLSVPLLPRSGFTITHVVLIALLPVSLSYAWRYGAGRVLLLVCGLWFAATALVIYQHQVGAGDAVYHAAKPVTVAITFCGFLWFMSMGAVQQRALITGSVCGLAGVGLLTAVGEHVDPWKYGVAPPVTFAVVLLAGRAWERADRLRCTLLLGGIVLVNLVLGFRSLAVLVVVAAVVAAIACRERARSGAWWFRAVLGLLVALFAVYGAYGYLASNGDLGAEQQYKWESQSRVTGGVLLGARPELVASTVIVAHTPLLGMGPNFTVDTATRGQFRERLNDLGVVSNDATNQFYFGGVVYLHSAVFQQWAEFGPLSLAGLIFPLVLVLGAVRSCARTADRGGMLAFMFVAVFLLQAILISPWAQMGGTMLGLAAAASVLQLAKGSVLSTREAVE